MKMLAKLAIAAAIAIGSVTSAQAGEFPDRGLTLIWVTIKAYSGEGPWQACRRVYQRDVYQVTGYRGNKVRCRIEHSRIYQYGERLQNFNQY